MIPPSQIKLNHYATVNQQSNKYLKNYIDDENQEAQQSKRRPTTINIKDKRDENDDDEDYVPQ